MGTDGTKQLAKYIEKGNLNPGHEMETLLNIPVYKYIKMGIIFERPGIASYFLYYNDPENVLEPKEAIDSIYELRALEAIISILEAIKNINESIDKFKDFMNQPLPTDDKNNPVLPVFPFPLPVPVY